MTNLPYVLYTVVQHSGYGYAGKQSFKRGLEPRMITTVGEKNRVKKVGGMLFDDWRAADDFCFGAMYSHADGLTPKAQGEFSTEKIDDLAIYIPVRTVTG